MQNIIPVTFKSTRNAYFAARYLEEISAYPMFAWDFEVAVKFTKEELEGFKEELLRPPTKQRKIELEACLSATALGHPSYCTITHCSIAISDREAYVFILDNPAITKRVLNFLSTSTQKQLIHNATFDFKHLYFHTGKMPSNYEDTQIFAKTILNHVEVHKATTGLKELVTCYGQWGIAVENFSIEHMYAPHVLKYSATDACACFYLYEGLLEHCNTSNTLTT